MTWLNLDELEAAARERLPPMAWGYYAGGADDELCLRGNCAAYRRWSLYHRVLVDVSRRELGTTVLGQPIALPIMVAPTAYHKLAHPEGEVATARAAAGAGTTMIVSTLSTTAVEDLAATGASLWFQLYVYRDRDATAALVERVERAGCKALVLTVDAPLIGRRERDVRNGFALPSHLRMENLRGERAQVPPSANDSGLAAWVSSHLDPALSWKDVAWLRGVTKLPILLKGVVRADDARRAVDHGVAGIVVSNHGGRQLDASPPTLDALPGVVEAVAGRAEVLVDGGVRRGSDVIKAIALGARAVLIGRPVLWGLAVDGAAGVAAVLAHLRAELDLAMALCGCASVADMTRDLLEPVRG
ncbi:MAG TPA: alpha-hydroxy acid oxidase [Kofleriaceae bacterium]|nr:alpha-hydroxy acid oxidase [Kofleriaceae bacterium]